MHHRTNVLYEEDWFFGILKRATMSTAFNTFMSPDVYILTSLNQKSSAKKTSQLPEVVLCLFTLFAEYTNTKRYKIHKQHRSYLKSLTVLGNEGNAYCTHVTKGSTGNKLQNILTPICTLKG
jgi:hypothetical protein